MDGRQLQWIRWLAVLPGALLATAIVQFGSEAVFRYALIVSFGYAGWASWVAKALAAVLMGPIFLLTAWRIAPQAKRLVAVLALVAIVVWGISLVLGSVAETGPDWMLATGLCGIAGGVIAFRLTRCSQPAGLC
jgi:hypothetical protein